MTSSQLHTCHSEDVQAASTPKPPASACCLDKIITANGLDGHFVFISAHVFSSNSFVSIPNAIFRGAPIQWAVVRISSTVRGGRHALSQVPGLSFRGRRPQARNGCAVPGRLAESYTKFSLSSIARVAIDGRTGFVGDVIIEDVEEAIGGRYADSEVGLLSKITSSIDTFQALTSSKYGSLVQDATALLFSITSFRSVQEGSPSLCVPLPSSSRLFTRAFVSILPSPLDEPYRS
ncbi:hypothetical protein PRIPAC_93987 [Pristionchus pacificus]|uniref:Uncharacterized protein n=1 Tax=Pristionchus pacificus TaxID=54126 RepID=A0A2A6CCM5_PRIPA|nr:hypothetical protein PRIPAC_93987 [Pristionchus pacificus]|eukprot:PDM75985.1 hypothetical protein PRIPAC_39589 [Pristionchus pacificus]